MDLMIENEPSGLPAGAAAVAKPTMWWVSTQVTPITFERPAEDQRDAVTEAVSAALGLRRWAATAEDTAELAIYSPIGVSVARGSGSLSPPLTFQLVGQTH